MNQGKGKSLLAASFNRHLVCRLRANGGFGSRDAISTRKRADGLRASPMVPHAACRIYQLCGMRGSLKIACGKILHSGDAACHKHIHLPQHIFDSAELE